jgi:K+ transporter
VQLSRAALRHDGYVVFRRTGDDRAGKSSRFGVIRCKLFEAMHRNALAATEFFRIPPNRVIELGVQVEI